MDPLKFLRPNNGNEQVHEQKERYKTNGNGKRQAFLSSLGTDGDSKK